MAIRHPKDFGAGLMFTGFGIASIVIAASYPLGTAARMGPGYFPRILGILLILFGAILIVRSLITHNAGTPISIGSFKPLLIVLGSVVVFGIVVNWLGLILSSVLLIVLSSSASPEFRWKEALISGLVLAAGSYAAFVYGLGLQFTVWPTFIVGR
jgi:hypothetical protein